MFPVLLPTYNRTDIAFVRGEGSWLFADDGKRYLDFGAGIAVNAFGHANPKLVAALTEQAGKLWHTSNLYRVPGQESLAKKLVENSFADTVFFTNSGAEAAELAFKMARRYQYVSGHPERFQIISFEGAFHGRTMAAIAATGNEKYLEGFGPKMPGFDQVPLSGKVGEDLAALNRMIGPQTAALIIEPLQGEGGVRPVAPDFLRALRKICDDKGLLLIFDEIQTGVGRTGKLFAYEWLGITPDIMCVAKAIGGGFPLGALLATAEAAKGMTVGHPWHHLWRQSARHGGGQCRDGYGSGPKLSRTCEQGRRIPEPAIGRAGGGPSRHLRGCARPGPDAGPGNENSQYRLHHRRKASRPGGAAGRRQCGAAVAAADRQ